MRVAYLSHSYVPSRRADAVHVMKMCAAIASCGHHVTLVTKNTRGRLERAIADDHSFYGVQPSFSIVKLPRPGWRGGGLVFDHAVKRLIRRESPRTDLFYCRDVGGARHAARAGVDFVFEAHVPPQSERIEQWHRELLKAPGCKGLVVITAALLSHLQELGLLPPGLQTVVAPDAADDPSNELPSANPQVAAAARPRVGYIGQIYKGRGIDLVLTLADRIPGASFHVVGGEEEAIATLRSQGLPDNLVLHGFVPPAEIAAYHRAFDILLMPYESSVSTASGRTDSSRWMSPMKMFEYMASNRPVIASDLPVLREILRDGENALLVPPEDDDAWEGAIRRLTADSGLGSRLAAAALNQLRAQHTWTGRALRVFAALRLGPQ